jgi:4-nitrophenyl phosphatase
VAFDADGVLWQSGKIIPGTAETLATLKAHGVGIRILTNNSTKTQAEYYERFKALHLDHLVSVSDIYCTAVATANYILRYHSEIEAVFVLGSDALRGEITRITGKAVLAPDAAMDRNHVLSMALDPRVGAVVVGMDWNITYSSLAQAVRYLTDGRELPFIATNPDSRFPMPGGFLPGTGSILAAVKTPVRREPVVVGKPSPQILVDIMAEAGVEPQDVTFVGDNVHTDILAAHAAGCANAVLVLTGVSTVKDSMALPKTVRPTHVIDSVADLPRALGIAD